MQKRGETVKKMYTGGTILTMDRSLPRVEAVLTENGKILKTGTAEVLRQEAEQIIDLKGCTLMPGFIDGHSHMIGMGMELVVNCSLDGCRSFSEILERIAAFRKEKGLTEGQPIMARGYDLELLQEGEHPTAAVLDRLGVDNPVACIHKSLHMGVYNTVAMEQAGVLRNDYVCPENGFAQRDAAGDLTGYFEEGAKGVFAPVFASRTPGEDIRQAVLAAQELYIRNGFTTVQEGSANSIFRLEKLIELSREGQLQVDVVAYTGAAADTLEAAQALFRTPHPHLSLGGVKVFLDGSPQARTAWLRRPYEGETEYRGYPNMTDAQLEKQISNALSCNMQVLAHCNGDAACQQFINVWERVGGDPGLRPVMIHAQTVGADQLSRMPKLGMMPSFFVGHTWFWGDAHLRNLGQRGMHISPVKTALKQGLPVSFHQDCPVTKPDMLHSIWCAVNRITRQGVHLEKSERVDVYDALMAATVGAAYSYRQEQEKGILRPGALADMIILDKDPTAVDPMEIRNIRVLSTIKEDIPIYQQKTAR